MKKILKDWWLGGGVAYNAYLQAVIDQAEASVYTLPSAATLAKLNTFAVAANANIAAADIFYVFRMNDANLGDFARINWAAPASNLITVVSGAVYGTGGYAGDATADYLRTGWQPADGPKYLQDDASIVMGKSGTLIGSTQVPFGATKTTATASRVRMFWNANLITGSCNSAADDTQTGLATVTWLGTRRNNSANFDLLFDATVSNESDTSTAVTPIEMPILCQKVDAAFANFIDGNAEFFAAGSYAMEAGLRDLWNSYVASL